MSLGIVSRSFKRGKPHAATTIDGFVVNGNPNKPRANTWYVDPLLGTAGASGSVDAPFSTLTLAVAAASAWDTIYIAGGDLTEEDVAIDKRGLRIIGSNPTGYILGGQLMIGSAAHILRIRADDVEIAGLAFYQTGAFACITGGPSSLNTWRPYIHDCMFGGAGTSGTSGIRMTDDIGADAPYALIERCKFYDINGDCVYLRAGVATVRDCHFNLGYAGSVGVNDDVNGASKPGRTILNNRFSALVGTATGVKITQTPSAGQLMIDGNHFTGFTAEANAVALGGKAGLMGLNYFNASAMAVV